MGYRTGLGPNEVDVKDLSSLPNASKKDSAVPKIQKYAEPPKKKQASIPKSRCMSTSIAVCHWWSFSAQIRLVHYGPTVQKQQGL